MKKIILLCVLAIGMMADAQTVQTIAKPLKLNVVPAGTAADSVLVRGADKIVKFVPRSQFGGGFGVGSLFGLTDTISNSNRHFNSSSNNFDFLNIKNFSILGVGESITYAYDEASGSNLLHQGDLGTPDWIFIPNDTNPYTNTAGEEVVVKMMIDGVENNLTFISTPFPMGEGEIYLYTHAPIAYTVITPISYTLNKKITHVKMDVPRGVIGTNPLAYFEGNELKKSTSGLDLDYIANNGATTNKTLTVKSNDNKNTNSLRQDGLVLSKAESLANISVARLSSLSLDLENDDINGARHKAIYTPSYLSLNKEALNGMPTIGDESLSIYEKGVFYSKINGDQLSSGNSLIFENQGGDTGANPQFRFPLKPNGVYTLATKEEIILQEYTVSTLPAGTKGDVAFVNDAASPTFLATVVGGGSSVVRVFYNGSNWIVQ